MSRRRAPAQLLVVCLAIVLAAGGCVTTANPFPQPGASVRPAGDATSATVSEVIRALSAAGLRAAETDRSYRPAEGPLLAGAPRKVVQVTLPADPEGAFIVVYGFDSNAAAHAAAEDHAAYLAAGFGGLVQYPPGTQFVIRVIGSSVVFFSWLPAASPDAGSGRIAEVLGTIGNGVPVPA